MDMVTTALNRLGRALGAWIVLASIAYAGQASPTPTTRPINDDIEPAERWVGSPAEEERIEAFSPSADVRYRRYDAPKPLRLWIARIDVSRPGVRVAVTEPAPVTEDGKPFETRCANTLEFARQRGVQLAINTSAFAPFRSAMGLPMDVVGLGAVRGEVYSKPDARFGALYISRSGQVSLKGPPLPARGVWHAIAGFRMLVDDDRVAVSPDEAATTFGGPQPRTAVGTDRAGKTLWLVVVDGRQKGISEGVTLVELACLFRSLGAWDALNLDGGGSSTLVVENADHTYDVVNTPVGRGQPDTLRQVAANLGLYLPGIGKVPDRNRRDALRDELTRQAASRRGGGYEWKGDGVSKDIPYDGRLVLRRNPNGTFCCEATLEVFLDAYCSLRYGHDCSRAQGRWFESWPADRFRSLQHGWWGMEEAPTDPNLPEDARPTLREKQVYHTLPWAGMGEKVDDYRLLQRGDLVQFWRKKGSGHSVIFWGRDWDDEGRERLWYWSSQGRPRHAYPAEPDGPPVKTPGYGVNWEYVGDEIDPARIYGVRPTGLRKAENREGE